MSTGRIKRAHLNRRGNHVFEADMNSPDGELNGRQKIKIMNTLSEFVMLNKSAKPKIFDSNGNEVTDANQKVNKIRKLDKLPKTYKFEVRDPYNQLDQA